jgi:hypothetical protein
LLLIGSSIRQWLELFRVEMHGALGASRCDETAQFSGQF